MSFQPTQESSLKAGTAPFHGRITGFQDGLENQRTDILEDQYTPAVKNVNTFNDEGK